MFNVNILGAIAQVGWRKTFRMLRNPDNKVVKNPPSPDKAYAQIRRRDENGKRAPARAYQLVEIEEGRKPQKTYLLVDDGGPMPGDQPPELVLVKKHVMIEEERRKRRRIARETERKERKVKEKVGGRPRDKDASPRKHRRARQPDSNACTDRSAQQLPIKENTSIGQAHSSRISKLGDRDSRKDSASNPTQPATHDQGMTSAFMQPGMTVRESQAFVFGEDVLDSPDQSQVEGFKTCVEGRADPVPVPGRWRR